MPAEGFKERAAEGRGANSMPRSKSLAAAQPKDTTNMPHPCDHPAAALAITRGLPSQLQKAKQNDDHATARAIEAALVHARRIVAAESIPPGWAEIVEDRRRQRRW
jgi:hypothetical protein